MHSQHPATNDGSMVPPTRRTTRPKSQRRSAAVAIAAERGDLGAVKAMLGDAPEQWLAAKRPALDELREQAAQLRRDGNDAQSRKVATQAQRLAHEVEAAEAAQAADFDRVGAASACSAARQPALHCAVAAGHEAIMEVLLEAGAPIRARNRAKRTALHLTAIHSTAAPLMARLLREPDAPCNAGDTVGSTPLHYAAGRDDAEQVAALVAAGATVNLKNKQLCTALHSAAAKGAANAARALLAASADIDAVDGSYRSPLHLAARDGRSDMVALLLKAGADRTILDRNGASFASHAQPHVIEDIYGPDGVLAGAPRPGDTVGPKEMTKKQIQQAEYAAAEHMAKIGEAAAADWSSGGVLWWLAGGRLPKLSSRPGPLRDRQIASWMFAAAQAFGLLFLLFAGVSFVLVELGGPGNATETASMVEI